jgi:tetratricopeptide (TPR) repeat protein
MVSRLLITASVGVMVLAGACGGETSSPERAASRSTESPTAIVGPNEARVHYDAGVHLQKQGKLDEALAEFDEAIRLVPTYTFDEAIRLVPTYTDAYMNRGGVYRQMGLSNGWSATTTPPSA